jgi:hypothetical protein
MTVKDKFVVTVVSLLYIMYPMLVQQSFAMFNCYMVHNKDYLLADLNETCFGTRHLTYVIVVGIPQLIIYIVGLPIVGTLFVYRNRRRLDSFVVRARYSLIFGGYKSDRYFWEIFVTLRKVLVIAIGEFGVALEPEMQALLVVLLVGLCYGLQQLAQPYAFNVLNIVEMMMLAMLLGTLWAGLAMFKLDGDQHNSAREAITVITILSNTVLVGVVIFVQFGQCVREARSKGSTSVAKLEKCMKTCGADTCLTHMFQLPPVLPPRPDDVNTINPALEMVTVTTDDGGAQVRGGAFTAAGFTSVVNPVIDIPLDVADPNKRSSL